MPPSPGVPGKNFSMNILKLTMLIGFGVALTMVGDVFLKRSNGLDRPGDLMVGFLFYGAGCIPVVAAFKRTEFGLVFIIWEALTVVLAIAIGRLLFAESITLSRLFAMILALGAILLSLK
jgi:multidrug transporter EmrE-like cation transporter